MADITNFKKFYEAYFRKSLEREIDVWFQFISDCDEAVLRDALDTLEEVYTARKHGGFKVDAPTFPEVKREYWAKKHKRDGSSGKSCNPDCAQCEGIGVVRVVIQRSTKRFLHPRRPEPIPASDLGYATRECSYAFCIRQEDKGKWYGWSLNRMENDCRVFIDICDKMYKKQQAEGQPQEGENDNFGE